MPHWTGFDLPGRALGRSESLGYARACLPAGRHDEREFLALQIAVMTAMDDAFESLRVPLDATIVERLVPWRVVKRSKLPVEFIAIGQALAALDRRLLELVAGDAPRRAAVRAWWRVQAEQQVLAFRGEADWRLRGTQPSLPTYLKVSARSIGVDWTAATLIALDPDASVPGPRSIVWKAIDSIARAIRLANDLHDPERERGEGKPQWLLLRASALMRRGLSETTAEQQAHAELRSATRRETERARRLIHTVRYVGASEQLRDCFTGLLGIGLAVYAPDLTAAA
jgi:hypothetical protein